MDRPVFTALTPGLVVEVEGQRRRLTHIIGEDAFLGVDLETNVPERHRISDITGIPGDSEAPESAIPDLDAIPDAAWAKAQKRYGIIKPLLEKVNRQRSDVDEAAATAGVASATVYRWIHLFERSGHVSSLLPGKVGRRAGTRLVDPSTEALIKSAIDRVYLTKQRKRVQPVIAAVLDCR